LRVWALAALTIAAAVACTPQLSCAQPAEDTALRLARAIERRAETSSFADLERFGGEATRRNDREALRRLHHVAFILLNQSEFEKFDHWNGLLAAKAQALGDRRYADIARIDALKSRFDRGESAVSGEIAAIVEDEPDWFAKVHAISIQALILGNERKAGAALKELFDAQTLVPAQDPDAPAAQFDIWSTIGLQLIQLNDLEGSAAAFEKADFGMANHSYPQPDFDDVYNMAYLAVQLGDKDLARSVVAIHHRLAMRSDLPHLDVWDESLCAMAAEHFETPGDVMTCLAGLDAKLTGAEFLAPRILVTRGEAEARLGRLADAKADLVRLQKLEAGQQFSTSQFTREPELEAELMAAQGHPDEAFALLRQTARRADETQAAQSSVGVRQVTAELERQLTAVERQARLQTDVARGQRWIGFLCSLLALGALAGLLWQRRVSRRLQAATERAEAASRAKSEFLANMSHEIRTPLNGVVGVADLLARAQLPERERRMAEIIRSSGQSLERLLSDVLDLARVEAGQLAMESAAFHAGDLMRAVAALCRLRADEKGLALGVEIDPALEGWFLGDAVRVRQILTNLTSNAVKFTESGSVTLRGVAPAPGRLKFEVIDTGVGFSTADKERLFGRFQQADGSITRRFGGSGLGLAISRQLADLMRGFVDCESVAGEGSRFWFEAPFEPAAAPAEGRVPEPGAGARERPVRVLVADDHATNQLVVRMMLESFGIEAVEVSDGAQAVDALRREGFDAVLMDMQMPVMDGLDATRLIRSEERLTGRSRTPILVLSANALREHRDAALAAGADGHVAKPVTVAGLMSALNGVLERDPAALAASA
jgi:signal transduction histidine kinase/CheY-like chemotaxis protein